MGQMSGAIGESNGGVLRWIVDNCGVTIVVALCWVAPWIACTATCWPDAYNIVCGSVGAGIFISRLGRAQSEAERQKNRRRRERKKHLLRANGEAVVAVVRHPKSLSAAERHDSDEQAQWNSAAELQTFEMEVDDKKSRGRASKSGGRRPRLPPDNAPAGLVRAPMFKLGDEPAVDNV